MRSKFVSQWVWAMVVPCIILAPTHAEQTVAWDHGVIRGEQSLSDTSWQYLIRNEKDWELVWEKRLGKDPKLGLPAVDFSKEAVVAMFVGNRPTIGFSVAISSFTDPRDPKHLVVYYRDVDPPRESLQAQVTTQPFALLKIELPLVVEVIYDDGRFRIDRSPMATKPAAEATAKDDREQLTLRLYKTKFRAGEPLRYQFAVKNVGREDLNFNGPQTFWDPEANYGIDVDIERLDGKPFDSNAPVILGDTTLDAKETMTGMTAAEYAHVLDLRSEWKKDNLSFEEIEDRTFIYIASVTKGRPARGQRAGPSWPALWIMPGGTATTPTWVYWPELDRSSGQPKPKTVAGYAQSWIFNPTPGKYKVRANTDIGADVQAREHHRKLKPGEAGLRTPYIRFEVRP